MKKLLTNKIFITCESLIVILCIYFVSLRVPFLQQGGFLMIPLIYASCFVVIITIERLLYFKSISSNINKWENKLSVLLDQNNNSELNKIMENSAPHVFNIIKTGQKYRDLDQKSLEKKLTVVANNEVAQIEKRMSLLAMIAKISPLMGLLGTVTGLMKAFIKIKELAGNVNASVLAGGISEALITTIVGLTIAIITMVIYQYLNNKVDMLVLKIEKLTGNLVLQLKK